VPGSTLSRRASEFLGVVLFATALFWLIALATYDAADPVWFFNTGGQEPPANFAGRVGAFLAEVSYQIVGFAAYLLPVVLVTLGWHSFWCRQVEAVYTKMIGLVLTLGCAASFLSLAFGAPDPAPGKPVPANWRTFFATGMAPAFDRLSYIARAVTPATRPMRFNARFFMIDAAHTTGDLGGDGELLNLTFMPLARTRHLELPRITARVLSSVEELVLRPPAPSSVQTVPFWRHINGTHVRIDE